MAQAFSVSGKLLLSEGLVPGALWIDAGRIVEVARGEKPTHFPVPTVKAEVVSPGLIDAQVNGGFGVTVGVEGHAVSTLAVHLPSTGVTAFCPTLVSLEAGAYRQLFNAPPAALPPRGAYPIGWHLEGPFLTPERRGAHGQEAVARADDALFDMLLSVPGLVLMTLAPDRPGALMRLHRLLERGVRVSLGHTEASYEAFRRAVDAGATLTTHLYNAMSPFSHRAPGAVGATLFDPRVTAGLIADGVHAHPLSLVLALKIKGSEGLMLVTDAIAGAGLGPGRYPLGSYEITVDATSARLPDGTLAGSTLTLDRAVRNMVQLAGATPAQALKMASETPARALGLENRGRLAAGANADLVLMSETLEVQATYIAGERVYPTDGQISP